METVVILICTFDRPRYLDELLMALTYEVSSAECTTLSVVVVDNGTQEVRRQVEAFRSELPVEYIRLPGSGLVGARNCSLRCGLQHKPDFLVFIDDDEVPEMGWLNSLVSALRISDASFAVGPVQPRFEETPPSWVPGFFTKSGEAYCTSNLIIRASIVPRDESLWFQARFNLTGGEDSEFLGRLAESGATSVVASNSLVYEQISRDRVSVRYLWRRSVRDGVVISMLASAKTSGKLALLGRILPKAAKKFVYGLNHLTWSLADRGRLPRAVDDFALATGLVMGSFNFSINIYGDGK